MQARNTADMEKYVQKRLSPRKLSCQYLLEEILAHHVSSTNHWGNTALIETQTEDYNSSTQIVLVYFLS